MSGTPSSSGPDTSDPGPPSGFNSIFQTPGGPPLILVCIAAGLLLGAFIGVLLMRRMRPGVVVQRVHGGRVAASQFKLGERPKLLDIHIVPRTEAGMGGGWYGNALRNDAVGGTRPEAAKWTRVTPFAASHIPSSEPSKPPPPSPPAAPPSPLHWHARRVQQLFTRLRRSAPHAAHDPHAPSTSSSTDLRRVQLAVAVTMPNPKQPQYARPPLAGTSTASKAPSDSESNDPNAHNGNDRNVPSSEDDDPMPDCCIGTVVVQYLPPPEDNPNLPPIPEPTPSASPIRSLSGGGVAPAPAMRG